MQFLSLEPFVPSGPDFELSKLFFIELGFNVNWEVQGYAGMQLNDCRFILQHFDKKDFAENFMISVKVSSVEELLQMIHDKSLTEKYPVRVGKITEQSYGKELNVIDIAGVCWHFVQY